MFGGFRRFVTLVVVMVTCAFSPASAQNITLKSADGTVALSGELIDYDGDTYKIKTIFGVLTVNALGVTCGGRDCPDPGQFAVDITLSGTATILNGLLPGLIEDFSFQTGHTSLRYDHEDTGWTYFLSDAARVPMARMQVNPGNTPAGFADLASGQADLSVTTRLPSAAEIKAGRKGIAGDLASGHSRQVLAVDGLVFILSPKNPINALTTSDLGRVFTGEISNWAAIGGVNAPIHLYSTALDSDLMKEFERQILPADGQLALITVLPTERDLARAVIADPFAIAVVGFAGIRNAKVLAIAGGCGMRQTPTEFSIQSGDYPLSMAYYLFQSKARLPVFAQKFLSFLDSENAQTSITDLGYIGQRLHGLALTDQNDRVANAVAFAGKDVSLRYLQHFITLFTDARRLSASFRFDDNSTKIDAISRRNIRVLANMIEVGDFDGKTLIFAGFSDSQGGQDGNRRISLKRAKEVASLVKKASPRADLSKIDIQVMGLGEVSPLACNDDAAGRQINRRVEIWLKEQ